MAIVVVSLSVIFPCIVFVLCFPTGLLGCDPLIASVHVRSLVIFVLLFCCLVFSVLFYICCFCHISLKPCVILILFMQRDP